MPLSRPLPRTWADTGLDEATQAELAGDLLLLDESGQPRPATEDQRLALVEQRVQQRRLRQLAKVMFVGLVVTAAVSALDGDWVTLPFLCAGLGVVALGHVLNLRGATRAAGLLTMWSLTVMASVLMWFNQGPYSPAVLVFPCVLMVSSMTLRGVNFFALLGYMVLSLGGMTYLSQTGLKSFSYTRYGGTQMSYTVAILLASAIVSYLFGADLRRAMARWQTEVARVNASRRRLSHLARHDALTELPNRLHARHALELALAAARQQGRRVALMFVDIDNFKSVNDSLGHAAGDELLRQAGTRLRTTARPGATVARQGGDEFLAVLPEVADAAAVAADAARLLQAFGQPFALHGLTVATSCSIGIAVFPEDGADADTLLQRADMAVHHAKDSGRNLFRFYDEAMNTDVLEDLSINTGLRLALERDEFRLHYQPVFDLASGRLVGAEALLRWHHPSQGVIGPARFIPAAERSGLIVDTGHWVVDEACRQLTAWQGGPLGGLILSINTSGIQFKRGTVEDVIRQALARHGAPAGQLEVEITESTLVHDAETLLATLQRLKSLGIRLAIDDFGTGYSNLSYLQRFAVDKLKIDQSFVRRLTSAPQDAAIVRAIIQMAGSLHLQTTAEGIEDAPTRAMLLALGCEQGQGYYLGRPQPLAAFERFCAGYLAAATR